MSTEDKRDQLSQKLLENKPYNTSINNRDTIYEEAKVNDSGEKEDNLGLLRNYRRSEQL